MAQGGTAVGTGLDADYRLAALFAAKLAASPGGASPRAQQVRGAGRARRLLLADGALATIAASLFKIANDIRLLGSGPRSGLGELLLPENEPGSSIMPGKVNPTQCEAVTMVCAQVSATTRPSPSPAPGPPRAQRVQAGDDTPAALDRAARRRFESFTDHCVAGIEADRARFKELMQRSLMLVTALAPPIGYDRAGEIAKDAHKEGATLREAALPAGRRRRAEDSISWCGPRTWVGPNGSRRPPGPV